MLNQIFLRYKTLSAPQRKKYLVVSLAQTLLGFLDLIGVAFLGVLGAIAIRGIQAKPTGTSVNRILKLLKLDTFSFQNQIIVIMLLSLLFLIGKSIMSLWVTKKIYVFLANCSGKISEDLTEYFLNRDIAVLRIRNTSEYQQILGSGVITLTIGVLGICAALVADISLLLIVGLGILALDPTIAIATFGLFGIIGVILYFGLVKHSRRIGRELYDFNVESNRTISEAILIFREIFSRNQVGYFSQKISRSKFLFANTLASQSLLPNISKYVFEIVLIVGAILVAGLQFITQDASHAIASMVVFLAAGSRIAPALLRVQQNLLLIHSNIESSASTLEFIVESVQVQSQHGPVEVQKNIEPNSKEIEFLDVSYTYPGSTTPAIQGLSLVIMQGQSIGIVGKSGSGKTTLADLLMGLLSPNLGSIRIFGMTPRDFIKNDINGFGYVPQQVGFLDGTIHQNIVLTDDDFDLTRISESLKIADLEEYAHSGDSGFDYEVGENGSRLSGGQRQRLGIARAMIKNPKILILDEATSALDATTEASISETINGVKEKTTLIVIAHRLSTIKFLDQIIYLDNGVIKGRGTFDEVRNQVPDFDQQAKLMGLV